MVVCIEIKVRHQLSLNMIYRFGQCLYEFIEVLLVKKDLMSVIPIVVKSLATFCNSEVVIIPTGSPDIKEVSPAFAGTDSFAVDALQFLVVVFVRHNLKFTVS